jgi:hypothetical protein
VVAVWCKEKKKEEEANESKQVDKQSGARRSGLVVQVDGGVATMGKVRCACMNQIKMWVITGCPMRGRDSSRWEWGRLETGKSASRGN